MWLLLACRPALPVPDVGTGLLGTGWANPFPSVHQIDESGHLALRDLPAVGATPIPIARLAFRTGFSPGQVAVLRVDGIDPTGFPTLAEPLGGTVRLVDLTAGEELPCLAEIDAFPDADERATLVRPLAALPLGHEVAVVVTTAALSRPERFALLLSDTPPSSLVSEADRYRTLLTAVSPFAPEEDVALAWSFPVADGTRPLSAALSAVTPGAYTLPTVRDAPLTPFTFRSAEGTFTAPSFLAPDELVLDEQGFPALQGTEEADLYVHIPASVADAPAGTVPVLIFGHGIFGDPWNYLADLDDPSAVLKLAEERGAIVLATTWRGLSASDLVLAIGVATDFGRFPRLTDHLLQAQVNVRTLVALVSDGTLLQDPVFEGVDGQLLPDPARVEYYGISLGAIEGMVFLANDPPITAAAFHVGGAAWSTMLERSSNWAAFELLLPEQVPNAADRQILYAVTQLWWDPVDPLAYVDVLADRSFLLQEAVGDEQVPNLTTEVLARSMGLPLLAPSDHAPFGLPTTTGGDRALVRFDPELPLPPVENRPAPVTGAHEAPRTWTGARQQVVRYLEGAGIQHLCGDAVCSASNTGDPVGPGAR